MHRTCSAHVLPMFYACRGWCSKFVTGLNTVIGCSSKSIWVIKLSFCQNDPLIGESFWQNNSLVTQILFELQLIMLLSPVANFKHHHLVFMYWTRNSMNNLLSYCGLVDARISDSEKDLPVQSRWWGWIWSFSIQVSRRMSTEFNLYNQKSVWYKRYVHIYFT
jgi:hypothetical protein